MSHQYTSTSKRNNLFVCWCIYNSFKAQFHAAPQMKYMPSHRAIFQLASKASDKNTYKSDLAGQLWMHFTLLWFTFLYIPVDLGRKLGDCRDMQHKQDHNVQGGLWCELLKRHPAYTSLIKYSNFSGHCQGWWSQCCVALMLELFTLCSDFYHTRNKP